MTRLLTIGLVVWASVATVLLVFLGGRPQQSSTDNQCETESLAVPLVTLTGRNEEHATSKVEQEEAQQPDVEKLVPDLVQKYHSEIFHAGVDLKNEKCTMVMLTYKRINTLPDIFKHYCSIEFLDKILVIWNDVSTPVPQSLLDLSKSCETKLQFIREEQNRLSNRFKPRPEIETDCVLTVDDDRKIEDLHDLRVAFSAWKEFRHRIVGFEFRTYTMTPQGTYWYGVYKGTHSYPGNCIMITATCLMHKAYLEMYHDPNVLPRKMFNYIDEKMNCEDIGISMMVAKFLTDVNMPQASILAVKNKGKIINLEGQSGGYRGLSGRPDHYNIRSDCINKFVTDFFGGNMPLRYTSIYIV